MKKAKKKPLLRVGHTSSTNSKEFTCFSCRKYTSFAHTFEKASSQETLNICNGCMDEILKQMIEGGGIKLTSTGLESTEWGR